MVGDQLEFSHCCLWSRCCLSDGGFRWSGILSANVSGLWGALHDLEVQVYVRDAESRAAHDGLQVKIPVYQRVGR